MSSRQDKYQKHGYLIAEICQTYPDLSEDLQAKMLEFRTQFPTEYRDWYYYELVPALEQLQRMQAWSHASTPVHGLKDHISRRQRFASSRSESRTIEENIDSCYKRYDLPHMFSTFLSSKCVLYGEGRQFSVGLYPSHVPESQYVTNLEQLKELIPFEDRKCFYEYLQSYIDASTHLSEKLLYQLVLLHLKFKCQIDPTDVSELLLNEYRKIQGEQFLKYSAETTMSRETFMSQPQDSLPSDISREEFISQDLNRDDYMSQTNGMSRDKFMSQDEGGQDEDKIVHRLRKLLLNGSKHKALRWAMENQEWVSALFIASSMDDVTYMDVCGKYIESIARNDPLRTCLQVQFGVEIDYQYSDDWGVHLAAILNNTENTAQILKFANILGGVKDICGQHFCFIAGRIQPSSSVDENTLYTLVGTENHLLAEQIPIQSVMLTMAYDNSLPHLQYYKYYVALNYVKMGTYELGLCLLQNIADVFLTAGAYMVGDHYSLASLVYDLSLTIYNRIHAQHITWISNLGDLINSTLPNLMENELDFTAQDYEEAQHFQSFNEPSQKYDYTYPQDLEETSATLVPTTPTVQSSGSSISTIRMVQSFDAAAPTVPMVQSSGSSISTVPMVQSSGAPVSNIPQYTERLPVVQEVSAANTLPMDTLPSQSLTRVEQTQPSSSNFYVPSFGMTPAADTNAEVGAESHPAAESCDTLAQPEPEVPLGVSTISLQSKFTYAEDKTDSPPQTAPPDNKVKETPSESKPQGQTTDAKGRSWLSFMKFALPTQPNKQMKLPKDDNPTIVWDEEKKMWVDKNSDGKSGPGALPPPPKMAFNSNPAPVAQPTESNPGPMSAMPPPGPMSTMPTPPVTQNTFRRGKTKYVNVLANKS